MFSKILLPLGIAFIGSALVLGQDFESNLSVQTQADPSRGVHVQQKLGSQLPMDDSFLDQTGATVTVASLVANRPAIILPIFYRCKGVCSIEKQSLIDSLSKMKPQVGTDFDVILLSVDPVEKPALAAQEFARAMSYSPHFKGTGSGWHFLTGSLENIRRLTDSLGFYFNYDAASDVVNHPSGLMFLSPNGTVSSYILNDVYTPDLLAKNLSLAGQNKVGQKSDDFFFGCVHTDPLTGKRSLVIQKVLSLAGLVMVVLLAGTVAGLSISSRRKSKAV